MRRERLRFCVSVADIFAAAERLQLKCAIGIIWLGKRGLAVDKASTNPRRLFYSLKSPVMLDRARIGDMLVFDKEPP